MNFELFTTVFSGRLTMTRIIMLLSAFGLFAIGLASIYAAGHPFVSQAQQKQEVSSDIPQSDEPSEEDAASVEDGTWKRQLVYAVVGILVFLVINFIDYRRLGPVSFWIYASFLVLLVVLLLDKFIDMPFVPFVKGSRRWIRIGTASQFVQVQPSEFCKIAYILALAWYLRFRKNYRHLTGLAAPFALTLLAMALILKEPDL
jgi:cell division protein FtsW (lipid II flippase)